MEKKEGYRTITYKFRLECSQIDWIHHTKAIYNEVLLFYYEVLKQEAELLDLNSMQMLRRLELLTIGTKETSPEQVKYPIPLQKVPLYFRRAAINDAIRLYRSFVAGEGKGAKHASGFQASPIYYKGMYRNFTNDSIELKLYDGERWQWILCGIAPCGRSIPAGGQVLSPIIKADGKNVLLHIPVKETVEDVRTVKERMKSSEKICAVAFPSNDSMAVLVLLDEEGECEKCHFIRGGNEFLHSKKKLLNRMKKNRASMGGEPEKLPEDENKAIKRKIHNLSENMAHKVSREIVDFCKENGVGILVVPYYKQPIDLNAIGYISATNYDWLGRRIISFVKYKAFGEGIMVTSVSSKDISANCYICGKPVRKYNKNNQPSIRYFGGKNFICPEGHKGNSYFNSAMNIGRKFLNKES